MQYNFPMFAKGFLEMNSGVKIWPKILKKNFYP